MQSFRVSALAGQIYAMPGMRTEVNLAADRPGTTRGENTQFSGAGFAEQSFVLRALPAAEFAAWAAAPPLRPLDAATYALLGHRATPAETARLLGAAGLPVRLGPVAPGLFDRVIARYHRGVPVPARAQPGAPAYDGGRGE
jgi:cytochrome o ubiquinol oxidase subunit 2